jgi:hypothetical protein
MTSPKHKDRDVQDVVAERVRWVFGDVAETILRTEEKRIGASMEHLDPDAVEALASDLKDLSMKMAGPELAERVYKEVLDAVSHRKPKA